MLALFFGILVFQILLNVLFLPLRIYSARHNHPEPQANDDFIPLLQSERISHAEYKAYLLSDTWKAKRKERLVIDEYQCQYCYSMLIEPQVDGIKSPLNLQNNNIPNVHHLNYNHLQHEDVMYDLVSLCKRCHLGLHATYDLPAMEYHINLHRGRRLD